MSRTPEIQLPFDAPFTAPQAYALGLSPNSLTRRVRNGEIVRLRRGVYAPTRPLTAQERISAALLTAPTGAVLAFEAAAVLLQVPIPHSRGLQRVDLYVAPGTPSSGGRPDPEVRLHFLDLPEGQSTVVDGIAVTSLARTAIDVSRSQPLERALIALDYARHKGVNLRALYDARYAVCGNRGVAILDLALRHSSALAESALESMSRGIFIQDALPAPELQVPLLGATGTPYRVDFLWRKRRLIGEADGLLKYADDPDAFRREKQREDDLRSAGFSFVRWTWDDLINGRESLLRRIRATVSAH